MKRGRPKSNSQAVSSKEKPPIFEGLRIWLLCGGVQSRIFAEQCQCRGAQVFTGGSEAPTGGLTHVVASGTERLRAVLVPAAVPVVSSTWLSECLQHGRLLPPRPFLLDTSACLRQQPNASAVSSTSAAVASPSVPSSSSSVLVPSWRSSSAPLPASSSSSSSLAAAPAAGASAAPPAASRRDRPRPGSAPVMARSSSQPATSATIAATSGRVSSDSDGGSAGKKSSAAGNRSTSFLGAATSDAVAASSNGRRRLVAAQQRPNRTSHGPPAPAPPPPPPLCDHGQPAVLYRRPSTSPAHVSEAPPQEPTFFFACGMQPARKRCRFMQQSQPPQRPQQGGVHLSLQDLSSAAVSHLPGASGSGHQSFGPVPATSIGVTPHLLALASPRAFGAGADSAAGRPHPPDEHAATSVSEQQQQPPPCRGAWSQQQQQQQQPDLSWLVYDGSDSDTEPEADMLPLAAAAVPRPSAFDCADHLFSSSSSSSSHAGTPGPALAHFVPPLPIEHDRPARNNPQPPSAKRPRRLPSPPPRPTQAVLPPPSSSSSSTASSPAVSDRVAPVSSPSQPSSISPLRSPAVVSSPDRCGTATGAAVSPARARLKLTLPSAASSSDSLTADEGAAAAVGPIAASTAARQLFPADDCHLRPPPSQPSASPPAPHSLGSSDDSPVGEWPLSLLDAVARAVAVTGGSYPRLPPPDQPLPPLPTARERPDSQDSLEPLLSPPDEEDREKAEETEPASDAKAAQSVHVAASRRQWDTAVTSSNRRMMADDHRRDRVVPAVGAGDSGYDCHSSSYSSSGSDGESDAGRRASSTCCRRAARGRSCHCRPPGSGASTTSAPAGTSGNRSGVAATTEYDKRMVKSRSSAARRTDAAEGARAATSAAAGGEGRGAGGGEAGVVVVDDEHRVDLRHSPSDSDSDLAPDASSIVRSLQQAQEQTATGGRSDDGRRAMPEHLVQAFVCYQGRSGLAPPQERNAKIIEALSVLLAKAETSGDKWRTLGYTRAIRAIKAYPKEIESVDEARSIRHVGSSIAAKMQEIIETGALRAAQFAQHDPTLKAANLFLGVWGAGPSTVKRWLARGYRTLEELMVDSSLTRQQRVGLNRYHDLQQRIPRAEVVELEAVVKAALLRLSSGGDKLVLVTAGSYRRGKETCGDVDMLITDPRGLPVDWVLSPLLADLRRAGFLTDDLSGGTVGSMYFGHARGGHDSDCCYMGVCKLQNRAGSLHRRIDIRCYPLSAWPTALLYFTGSGHFNRSMRLLARKMGYSLSDKALVVRSTEEPIPCDSEYAVFKALGLPYKEPHERDV